VIGAIAMFRTFAAVFLAATTAGCASAGAGTPPLRGHYYWGHEVEAFHPCGSKQAFWVVGDAALLQPLRDKVTKVSHDQGKPYVPIYVEASGVVEKKATDGFAADYDGVYRITAVQVVDSISPPDCQVHD
jgi:hypothetical protein